MAEVAPETAARIKIGGDQLIQENPPRIGKIEEIKDARDGGAWLYGKIAEQVPIMGGMLAAAGAATAAPVALGAGAGVTALAGGLGAAAVGLPLNAGEIYENLRDKGIDPDEARNYAIGFGVPATLLDSFFPVKGAGRVMSSFVAKKAAEGAAAKAAPGLARRALKEGGQGFVTEGLTETGQEGLGMTAERLATGEMPEDALSRLMNAAAAGAAVGGSFGAVTGIRPERTPQTPPAAGTGANDTQAPLLALPAPDMFPPAGAPDDSASRRDRARLRTIGIPDESVGAYGKADAEQIVAAFATSDLRAAPPTPEEITALQAVGMAPENAAATPSPAAKAILAAADARLVTAEEAAWIEQNLGVAATDSRRYSRNGIARALETVLTATNGAPPPVIGERVAFTNAKGERNSGIFGGFALSRGEKGVPRMGVRIRTLSGTTILDPSTVSLVPMTGRALPPPPIRLPERPWMPPQPPAPLALPSPDSISLAPAGGLPGAGFVTDDPRANPARPIKRTRGQPFRPADPVGIGQIPAPTPISAPIAAPSGQMQGASGNVNPVESIAPAPMPPMTPMVSPTGAAVPVGTPAEQPANPTPAQAEAGNYRKVRKTFAGLPVTIETLAGQVRRSKDPATPWEVTMPVDYGYVRRTKGSDGEQLDVFLGPNEAAPTVYVIDQNNPTTGAYDEQKAMVGFDSMEAATDAYAASFSDGKGYDRIGNINEVPIEDFRQRIKDAPDEPVAATNLPAKSESSPAPEKVQPKQRGVARKRKPQAVRSAYQAVLDAGGVRDDEGHDIQKGIFGRVTPLVRRNGRSVDGLGEILWDAGWWGEPDETPRPEESDVLEFLRKIAFKERIIHPADQVDALEMDAIEGAGADENDMLRAADRLGIDVDGKSNAEIEALIAAAENEAEQDAIIAAVEQEHGADQAAVVVAGADLDFDLYDDDVQDNYDDIPQDDWLEAQDDAEGGAQDDARQPEPDAEPEAAAEDEGAGGEGRPVSGETGDGARREGEEPEAEVEPDDGLIELASGNRVQPIEVGDVTVIENGYQYSAVYRDGDVWQVETSASGNTPEAAAQRMRDLRKIRAEPQETGPLADFKNDPENALAKLPVAQFAEVMNQLGLRTKGNKAAMIERIMDNPREDVLRAYKAALEIPGPTAPKTEKTDQGDNFILGGGTTGTKAQADAKKGADAQAEFDAKKKQQKARRGGQKPIADQEGGMFDGERDQGDMLKPPKAEKPKAPPAKPGYGEKNTVFSKSAAEEARGRLRKKGRGQLNAGIDPEMLADGITLAGYHIEAGARAFADFSRVMLADLGEWARPYLRSWYNGVRDYPGFDARGMTPYQEMQDVPGAGERVEPAGGDADAGDGVRPPRVSDERDGDGPRDRDEEQDDGEAGRDGPVDPGGLFPDGTPSVGARGNRPSSSGGSGGGGRAGQRGGRGGGGAPSIPRTPDNGSGAKETGKSASDSPDLAARLKAQKDAESVKVKTGDIENIRATLPLLLPGQQDDVKFAEDRFAKPGAFGVMFTNGTGTGKTFTGLGVVKRFQRQGKTNTLIVVPTQDIASDWIKAGAKLGLDITSLDSTTDVGKGIVVTTYNNLDLNRHLSERDWDLVVSDEAHKLSSNKAGETTGALRHLRAITNHPDGRFTFADMKLRDMVDRLDAYRAAREAQKIKAPSPQEDALQSEFNARRQAIVAERERAPRSPVVFLSATPFAYVENIDYANGYLFDYPQGTQGRGYNQPDGYQQFFIENFGYRMRTGKLTKPESEVNSEVMERMFHEKLRDSGALSRRMLDVDADYDRKFVLVDDAVGTKIDNLMRFIHEERGGYFRPLNEILKDRFDYLARLRLLEAIKANHAVDYIKKQHALGRKVVVFHDYNVGGGFNPFDFSGLEDREVTVHIKGQKPTTMTLGPIIKAFQDARPDAAEMNFGQFFSPIDTLSNAFPGALIYNGNVPVKQRTKAKADFNDDNQPDKNLIVVQSAAGEFGISLHDTTGKNQRVMINLGLPARPVTAIQEEGRIYRTGQVTDAVFRYFNTGTSWERSAFARRMAERSATAENLAMGNQARALRSSFIDAYNDSDAYPPAKDEGKGGKEIDRANDTSVSPFERAKTFYYAQAKKKGRRDQREGIDYYPTPEPVGFKMVEFAQIAMGEAALEPSAGHGAIARFLPEFADRTLVEPSTELASKAELASPGARVVADTFEELNLVNKYDAIVMNPPYGIGGPTAIAHLAKAVKHLRDGGRIVALLPTRQGSFGKKFDKWYESDDAKGIHLVAAYKMPTVLFERAGTSVSTEILVFDKQTDPETAAKLQQIERDYSSEDTIGAVFNRIKNAEAPKRIEPKVKEINLADGSRITVGNIEFEISEGDGPAGGTAFAAKPKTRMGDRFANIARLAEEYGGQYLRYIKEFVFTSAEARNNWLQAIGRGDVPKADVAAQGAAVGQAVSSDLFTLGETKHSKTGAALFVASMKAQVSREKYNELNALAKRYGSGYSSWRGPGAIPGFQFKSAESRAAFLAAATATDGPKYSVRKAPKTDAFRRWFGNSKVVDENGEPLVVYHGTRHDIEAFDGPVFFSDVETASSYAKDRGYQGGGTMYPAYLSLQNPASEADIEAVATELGVWDDSLPIYQFVTPSQSKTGEAEKIVAALKAKGFDGAIIDNDYSMDDGFSPVRSYVAFDAGQIKSATGNSGAFDPANPRINFSVRRADRQTETSAFKRWFGESKVADQKGSPLVVYHGTSDDIEIFDLDHPNRKDSGWLGTGVYLTSDPGLASAYSSLKAGRAGRNVMPLYARLENPYYASLEEKRRIQFASQNKSRDEGRRIADEWTRDLIAKGHDGVILQYDPKDVGDANASTEYVVFDRAAVKSATGNSGAFDPADPRIQYSPSRPISAKQFYKRYWQHTDVRARKDGKGEERAQKILADGWSSAGGGPNIIPAYNRDKHLNAVEVSWAARPGDVVYLVPPEAIHDTPNGPKVKAGWKPKPYEVVRVEDYNRPMYDLFIKAWFKTEQPQVDTPEFKKWFEGSAAVNKDGTPKLVFHGGNRGVQKFRIPAFFTSDREGADWYRAERGGDTGVNNPYFLSIKNPLDLDSRAGIIKLVEIARAAGADVQITGEIEGDGTWEFYSPTVAKHSDYEGSNPPDIAYIPFVRDALIAAGYDGFVLSDVLESDTIETFVAFDQSQIKSADRNLGTFSPADPRVTFSARYGDGNGARESQGAFDLKAPENAELRKAVEDIIAQITGGAKIETAPVFYGEGEGLQLSGALGIERQEVAGMFDPVSNLISISMRGDFDALNTAAHEAWHWLKQNRYFTRDETLAMQRDRSRLEAVAAKELPGMDTAAMSQEELEAVSFAAYFDARMRGESVSGMLPAVRRAFERLWQLLTQLREVITTLARTGKLDTAALDVLAGRGALTAEAVFERALQGEIAARPIPQIRVEITVEGEAQTIILPDWQHATLLQYGIDLNNGAPVNQEKESAMFRHFWYWQHEGAEDPFLPSDVADMARDYAEMVTDAVAKGETDLTTEIAAHDAGEYLVQQKRGFAGTVLPGKGGEQFAAAWHGSPHDFDAFSLDKIGTGEGAQAYGWGLYFAGKREVAEHYRKALSNAYEPTRAAILKSIGGGTDQATTSLVSELAQFAMGGSYHAAKQIVTLVYNQNADLRGIISARRAEIEAAVEAGKTASKGRLFKVELAPAEDQYLLWDAPISRQSEKVKAAIKALAESPPAGISKYDILKAEVDAGWLDARTENAVFGSSFYGALTVLSGRGRPGLQGSLNPDNPRAASLALRAAGIRGIKYLDGSSRGMGGMGTPRILSPKDSTSGKWTVGFAPNGPNSYFDTEAEARAAFEFEQSRLNYNYVLFDDKDVSVTEKYSVKRATMRAPTAPKTNPITRQGNRTLDWINRVAGNKMAPLGALPEQKSYLIERYRALGDVDRVEDDARAFFDTLAKATKEQAVAIYDYLVTRGASPDAIGDAGLIKAAIDVKRRIDQQGRELVRRKLIPQESYEQNRDQYLPRVYLKHLIEQSGGGGGRGLKAGEMGYRKGRKDIPQEVRDRILGEIKDPAFLASRALGIPGRDLAILDFLETVAGNSAWVYPKSVTAWRGKPASVFWLTSEAERLRKQAQYLPNEPERAESMRALAKEMDDLAAPLIEATGKAPADYRQIPESPRYGMLAGLMVRTEIFNDIVGAINFVGKDSHWLQRMFEVGGGLTKATQIWKMSKVAMNPPSIARNLMSNAVMLQLSGVPFHRIPQRLTQAMTQIVRGGEYAKLARSMGINQASFARTEMFAMEREFLDLERGSSHPLAKLRRMGDIVTRNVGDFYQFTDSLFKIAKMIDVIEREGLTPAEAALEGHRWMGDYSLVPPSVQYLRNSPIGIPFITYTYKVLPLLLEVALTKPWRFAPYFAMFGALHVTMTSMYGVSGDDLEALKKALPEWMHDRGHAYVLPFKDDKGRWQVIDLGYIVPWGMVTDAVNAGGQGDPAGLMRATGVFGGPVPDLLAAIKTGIDPFTKRPIMDPRDPPAKQAADLMSYLWRMAAPTWVTDIGAASKLYDTINGVPNRRGEPGLTGTQAGLRFVGLNVYPLEPEKTRATNIRQMQFEIRDIQARMRWAMRDQSLSPEARERVRLRYQSHLGEKVSQMREYTKQSTLAPQLRA